MRSPTDPRAALTLPQRAAAGAKVGTRLRQIVRGQQAWGRLDLDLDAAVAEDDPVRSSWAVVERLELSARYVPVEARAEVAGAPALDPTRLLAWWIYATSDGAGSVARGPVSAS